MSTIIRTPRHRIYRRFYDRRDGTLHETLATVKAGGRLLDRAATALLRLGLVTGDDTLIEGVDCLPGGATIELDGDQWRVLSYDRYIDKLDRTRWRDASRQELMRGFTDGLLAACQRLLEEQGPERPIVLPLSGGLDSRAILAALLELGVSPGRIHTVTYGEEGALDFELGTRVARAVGTQHRTMNLSNLKLSPRRLQECARLTDGNTNLVQPALSLGMAQNSPEDAVHWSGYPGDFWGGAFHHDPPSRRFLEAKDAFIQSHQSLNSYYRAQDLSLPAPDLQMSSTGIYDLAVDHDELVFLLNHVERYTTHQIFFHGTDYACPFMEDEVVVFWLEIDQDLRAGKHLFNEALCERFPRLFVDIPTTSYGYTADHRSARQTMWQTQVAARKALWRVLPNVITHPDTKYVNFAHQLRARADVRESTKVGIEMAHARGFGTRTHSTALWRENDAGQNRAAGLTTLASLGYIMEAFDLNA